MALRLRLKVSSIGSPFLQLGSSASAACSVSKLGFHPPRLQLNKNSHPIRFLVRAGRTESKGVTLGFRAPQFQVLIFPIPSFFLVNIFFETWNSYIIYLDELKLNQLPEPLTGKVWTLEDFEAYPALLVGCHLLFIL